MMFEDELKKAKGFYIYGSFCDDFYFLKDEPILVFKINNKYYENRIYELDDIYGKGNIKIVNKKDNINDIQTKCNTTICCKDKE